MDSRPPARQRQSTRLAFHASRIVIDLGVLIVLGSMSLPFITAEAGDRTAIAADALPALLLVIPVFAVTMIPDHSRPLPAPLGWLSLVLAVAALPYAVVKYLDAGNVANTIGGEVGLGAKLLVFGTLVVVAGIVIGLARSLLRLPSGGMNPAPAQPRAAAPPSRRTRAQQTPAAQTEPAGRTRPEVPAEDPALTVRRAAPAAPDQPQPRRSAQPRQGPTAEPQGEQPTPRPRPQVQPVPRPRPQPQPEPAADDPDPSGGTATPPVRPTAPTPERLAPDRRVTPPRARRPVINPAPEHDALPKPKHPTGELPLPRDPSEDDTTTE